MMNPETIEPIDLPEVLEAEWGNDQLMQLFADLQEGTDITHVQLRTGREDTSTDLKTARDAFLSGQAQAIQVRYRYEGQHWGDTILPGDPTTKIIRTLLPV